MRLSAAGRRVASRLTMAALGTFAVSAMLAAPAAGAGCVAPFQDVGGGVCQAQFLFSGKAVTVSVPAGITTMHAVLSAGQGGMSLEEQVGNGSPGGLGGRETADVPVSPGSQLSVLVGQAGADGALSPSGYGGWPDGGHAASNYAGNGGGASYVFGPGGPLIVAGAGGGGGKDSNPDYMGYGNQQAFGGAGAGASQAKDGVSVRFCCDPQLTPLLPGGGGGASPAHAGAGGTPDPATPPSFGPIAGETGWGPAGSPSNLGKGGDSYRGNGYPDIGFAAGGGGGYFGGGGGGDIEFWLEGGGGGGGAGYVAAGAANASSAVGVQTGNGAVTLSYRMTPAPSVSSVTPSAGSTAGGNTVTVNGANFVSGATVRFGATASASVTFVSATQLRAVAPAHAAGAVDVVVTTPTASSATGPGDLYAYGAPAVLKVSPNAGPVAGGNVVTLTGARFVPGAAVRIAGVLATAVHFVSTSQLTATVPAHSAAVANVVVSTAAGSSPTGAASLYAYGAPYVTSVSPRSGPVAGGTAVTIGGVRFVPRASVYFGSAQSTNVMFVSSTQLVAVAPAHSAASVPVEVWTPGGTSPNTVRDLYAFGPPSVTAFTPSSGITGTTVTIAGGGFVPGVTVRFGTRVSPSVTLVSGTALHAVVPNGAVAAKVSVADAQGTGTSAGAFTPTLSVTGFGPLSGPAGTVVTISGVGFNAGSAVSFNGTVASAVTHVSPTQLSATVPAGATSGPIAVTNTTAPAGTVRSAGSYTVG